ncbi:MAG: multiprotein bridging factor aMBF1 [Candidatus Njordarchaeales archaeon]
MSTTYYCEICGRPILKPKYYEVEGAVLILCDECAKYGSPVSSSNRQRKRTFTRSSTKSHKIRILEVFSWDLVDNYGEKIRLARERMKLSQEDLARLIGEPLSFIKKIEREKIIPPEHVITKIEKVLKISLRRPIEPDEFAEQYKTSHQKKRVSQLTLGDVVIVRKPKKAKKKKLLMGD